ncbi:2-dehydropantoate 2-reductase [Aliiroseovarius sp. KMU-50]|uniref:2-dehydropantoate 2-reductase n=1 Tax=Aliiroseovarius salicola TaxID=3009082 RepID=A0ABT4W1D7_9RHOB|nr:2-dehydropantoate 2-reductase [Aliiroseovarius sp. KMU-50]MDA5094327.1 2-dehydropantoate 2-reductase [Aliiroseovarius sp. KMU-50]
MRIAMMATGGIGGFLAVKLTEAGHEVATIARGEHLRAIQEGGLRLIGPTGNSQVTPWLATDNPVEVGPVDAIIFGVKGDALDQAAMACKPMLGENTVVVPFLNGVEASDRLLAHLPEHNVANGVAKVSTTISAPGEITQTGEFATFIFAERDSRPTARVETLQCAMEEAGVSAPVTDDVERELWNKFILFSAMSGVTAAGRCTIGDIRAYPELTALFKAVAAETAAIGRAKGVALADSVEEDTWALVSALPPSIRASTAIDLEKGLPLEIDWLSGAACRLAKEYGIPAPANETLYAVLMPHKAGQMN